MKKKHILTIASIAILSSILCTLSGYAAVNIANISINPSKNRKPISPYIYGINSELMYNDVLAGSIRAGGNRYTAYNWENNFSNAGIDWKDISDTYFLQNAKGDDKNLFGFPAINLSRKCTENNNAYSIMTLQLAGYVSADSNGEVSENEVAPSERWNKVELVKGSDFTLKPDLNDKTVYMDEFVNYLVNTLGNSSTDTGIKAYSLDNEPALWCGTHSKIHPKQTTCTEIIDKSITMSEAVKKIDSGAEIFGPALYGFNAYTTFQGAPDWNEISQKNPDYRWFIDYYLDNMKKAEDKCGTRLLDVLDLHYYTEAKGECGERSCTHYNRKGCVEARMNSTRTLWDETYRENSWITDSGTDLIPILPNVQKSIDKYYPNTKIGITEYDFGGAYNVCGAIAEADALGIFAKYGVYCANLFAGEAPYQLAAINLYTNYDKKGNGFGDTLVNCKSDNSDVVCYASIDSGNEDEIKLVVMNKSFDTKQTAKIKLESDVNYSYIHSYGILPEFSQVFDFSEKNDKISLLNDNNLTFEMDPQTVTMLVISKDKGTFEQNGLTDSKFGKETGTTQQKEIWKYIAIITTFCIIILAGTIISLIFNRKKKKRQKQK